MARGAFLHFGESLGDFQSLFEASWSFWFRPSHLFSALPILLRGCRRHRRRRRCRRHRRRRRRPWSVPRRCSSSSPSTGSPSGRRRRRRLPTTTTYIGDRTSSHNSVSRRPSSYNSAWTHHPEDNDRARGSDGSPGGPRPFTRRPSASSTCGKCIHPPARICLARESSCNELRFNFAP